MAATRGCSSQHIGKDLTEDWRARWVALLQSAREAGLPNDPEFRSAFQADIKWGLPTRSQKRSAGPEAEFTLGFEGSLAPARLVRHEGSCSPGLLDAVLTSWPR